MDDEDKIEKMQKLTLEYTQCLIDIFGALDKDPRMLLCSVIDGLLTSIHFYDPNLDIEELRLSFLSLVVAKTMLRKDGDDGKYSDEKFKDRLLKKARKIMLDWGYKEYGDVNES